MKTERTRLRLLARGVAVGTSGAVSVFVIDSVLSRIPALNAHPVGRAGIRVAAAAAGAFAVDQAGAPSAVSTGVIAGPVLVSALDLAVSLIGRQRIDPPPPPPELGSAGIGAPWTPEPFYVAPVSSEARSR